MLTSLVPSKEDDEDRERFSPLTFVDDAFMPAGPSQGPFLQLLVHSPQNGLSAIRKLIDHIVLFKTDGRDPGANSITISLFGKERCFVWKETFLWSHGDFDTFAAASALMALEAWGHKRIESGESIESVVADVVGSGDRPMCYLAVAIDLIISHWIALTPLSAAFIGNPELLVLDRDRQIFDAVGGGRSIDIGGAFPEAPAVSGFDTIENLRSRPSRKCTLLQCLYRTVLLEDEAARDLVRKQLTASLQRLGPFGEGARWRRRA
jgi:hypothetical protein